MSGVIVLLVEWYQLAIILHIYSQFIKHVKFSQKPYPQITGI